MHRATRLPLTTAAAGVLGLAYALWEAHQFRLRRVDVPVLPSDAVPIRILQITDLHFTPNQVDKAQWLRSLATLSPDLVVNTGDNLAHRDAVPVVLEALAPLLSYPGVFVMGSNDYYAPVLKNPLRYFRPQSIAKVYGEPLPWADLQEGFTSAGWSDLNNHRKTRKVGDLVVDFVGTDDAHLEFDRYDQVQSAPANDCDISIGVTHAPYLRVVDRMASDRIPLILAGHTHGGQLCLPGIGALVTNCDLPTSQAKGLHPRGGSWLHVSAGLGTSPFAPVRFFCPPEATLLTLVPAA